MRCFERWSMGLAAACLLGLGIAAPAVHAGPREDCGKGNQDADLAIAACNKLIRANRRDASAFHNRAVAHFAKRFGDDRNVDRALEDLSEAIRLNPRDALSYANRGTIYAVIRHNYDLAIADYSEAVKLAPKANDYRVKRAEAYGSRAGLYYEKKDYDRAIDDYGEAIKDDPKVNYYIDRGRAFGEKKDYDRSIAEYSEAIRLYPSDSSPYFYRAMVYYYHKNDYDRAIADYSEAIERRPTYTLPYRSRGEVYAKKGDYDRAFADYGEAIRIDPKNVGNYTGRAALYMKKKDYGRALADYDEAIKIDPKNAFNYSGRAKAYKENKDYDRALADYDEAIRLSSGKYSWSFVARGWLYATKGDYDRAIADGTTAIGLNGHNAYHLRGDSYRAKRQYDLAIADLDKAVELNSKYPPYFASRGKAYEEKGERAKAMEDYGKALALEAKGEEAKEYQAKARQWLAALQAAPPPPATVTAAPAEVALSAPKRAPGRRVALVIGNAAYTAVPALLNPRKDTRDVAAALREAGFTEVVERYDVGIADMRTTLSAFEDLAKTADWAVVYYAGHGIEVEGRNYLVPVDARLKRVSDVEDEALPLQRVLDRVAVAQKLQLVILDACRDNPFARHMAPSGGLKRSIGARGLARFESLPTNLMIAYSAGKGEAALDGAAGENSPYARALVKYLAEPRLELGIFFRKVRADVLAATQGKQRPFEDSSLTDANLFFRAAAN